MTLFKRTDRSFLGAWWWTVDRTMISAILMLIGLGVVMVGTASPSVAQHLGLGDFHFLKRHVMMLVPGLFILIALSMCERSHVWRLASFMLVGSLIAMVAVLFTGSEIKGAQRWINLFGFSLQPSEFVKPAFIIISAWLIAMQKQTQDANRKVFPGNLISAGLYGVVIILLLLQPDLGMTVLLTAVWATQIFLAGLPFRYLFIFGGLGMAGLFGAYMTFDHVHSRINRFLDPESGDSYQVDKSLEAIQNGGFFGLGPGQGSVKLQLPDAHADFIFSVGAEEMGLIFVALVLGLFAFILLRGFNRLSQSDDMFSMLAAGGLLTMIGIQTVIHAGSAVNILPAKGMTLPFISYGGSSILALCFSMGAVLALTRHKARNAVARGGVSLHSVRGVRLKAT